MNVLQALLACALFFRILHLIGGNGSIGLTQKKYCEDFMESSIDGYDCFNDLVSIQTC